MPTAESDSLFGWRVNLEQHDDASVQGKLFVFLIFLIQN
jgi:hypothetical protein